MEKQRWEESEKRRAEERRSERRKSEKKEEAGARKGSKVAKHCVFPMICGSGGSKSRLAKAAGAEPSGQMRDEKLHAAVARSTFRSQNVQNTPGSDHFWKLTCRKSARRCGAKHICKWKAKITSRSEHFWKLRGWKVHAVVAQSTFPSQNVHNTSDHFWRFRCRKSARRCGAKHNSKSKYAKHTRVGALLEVDMSKKCTPLRCEAHFQVKIFKTPHVRTIFGRSDVVSRVMRKGLCTLSKVSKTWGQFQLQPPLHYTPLYFTPLHFTYNYNYNYNYTTLHYSTLH